MTGVTEKLFIISFENGALKQPKGPSRPENTAESKFTTET